ncbi:hypothetical protein LCGC14_0583170 [marine sediment metagenome]|uniref:HTH cro/C1-type domain-containing protein n=1 Tax=marine sediment metagenome TaxID=412755 RepID=A0A0F9RZF7_9ZZZZ
MPKLTDTDLELICEAIKTYATLRDAAWAATVGESNLCDIRQGKRDPSDAVLERMAAAWDMTCKIKPPTVTLGPSKRKPWKA